MTLMWAPAHQIQKGDKRVAAKGGGHFHRDGIFSLYLLWYVVIMLIAVSVWLFFCFFVSYRCILGQLFAIHPNMYFDCICVVFTIKPMSACEHTLRLWEILVVLCEVSPFPIDFHNHLHYH